MWEGLLGPRQQMAIVSPALLLGRENGICGPGEQGGGISISQPRWPGKSARVESQGSTEAEEMTIRRKEALAAPTSLLVTSRFWVKEVS